MKKNKTLVNTRIENIVINKPIIRVYCISAINMLDLPISQEQLFELLEKHDENNIGIFKNYLVFNTNGIARCDSEDEWDEEKGIYLAETRAQMKAYKIAARIYSHIRKFFDEQLKNIHKLMVNTQECIDKCYNHQKEIAG